MSEFTKDVACIMLIGAMVATLLFAVWNLAKISDLSETDCEPKNDVK